MEASSKDEETEKSTKEKSSKEKSSATKSSSSSKHASKEEDADATETTASSSAAADGSSIVVQSGEGAGSIAARAGISVSELERLNPDHMTSGYWYANPGDVVNVQ